MESHDAFLTSFGINKYDARTTRSKNQYYKENRGGLIIENYSTVHNGNAIPEQRFLTGRSRMSIKSRSV